MTAETASEQPKYQDIPGYRPQTPYSIAIEMQRLVGETEKPHPEETEDVWFVRGQLDSMRGSLTVLSYDSIQRKYAVTLRTREELGELLTKTHEERDDLGEGYGSGAEISTNYPLGVSYTEGRVSGMEWVLGMRESLDREQTEPQTT